MKHDFNVVFDTENEYWKRVAEIFEKNEKYPKKRVSNRNLHHKFPRSFSKMLGEPVDNDPDNLISLSLADHFLVHYYYYLLARKGFRQRMATAFIFMSKKSLKYITPETAELMAREYEEAKVIADQYNSERNTGKKLSEETKRKMSESRTGMIRNPHTEETKKKISEKQKGNKYHLGKPHSEESKRKNSESHLGHVPWNKGIGCRKETKEKLSVRYKGKHWKLVDGKRVWYD